MLLLRRASTAMTITDGTTTNVLLIKKRATLQRLSKVSTVFDVAQAESLIADDFQSISDSNGNFYPDFVVCYSSLNVQSHIQLRYPIFTRLR
jgi:hypothetical protein